MIKYFCAVVFGYLIDFFIYYFLVGSAVSIYLSASIAFFFGSLVNLLLIRQVVFTNPKYDFAKDLFFTLTSNISIFIVGILLLYLFYNVFGVGPYCSKVSSNLLTFLINFHIRKFFFTKA